MSNRTIEAVGYLISVASVALLAFAAWQGTAGQAGLRMAVVVGAAFSIIGMGLRWIVFWRRHGPKHRKQP